MSALTSIRVQKLFLVTLVLKIVSSTLGWWLASPWILGFLVPLSIMGIYIVLGMNRSEDDVSDEKFADSCYYLGFLFTITSIILCLFDLPTIGMNIQSIAVRFGAAMVSTVLGLGVRIYLIGFRKDASDALHDVESSVIEISGRLREQLLLSFEKLRDFEGQVASAAQASIERTNLQNDSASKNHAHRISLLFDDLKSASEKSFDEAGMRLASAHDQHSQAMADQSRQFGALIEGLELKVGQFADAMDARLKSTVFPDDFFQKELAAPLTSLVERVQEISSGVSAAGTGLGEYSQVLKSTIKLLRTKSASSEGSLDRVIALANQQESLFNETQGQLAVISGLAKTLDSMNDTLSGAAQAFDTHSEMTNALTGRVDKLVLDSATSREEFGATVAGVTNRLSESSAASTRAAERIERVVLTELSAVSQASAEATSAARKAGRAAELVQAALSEASLLRPAVPAALSRPSDASTSERDGEIDALRKAVPAGALAADSVLEVDYSELDQPSDLRDSNRQATPLTTSLGRESGAEI